MESIRDCVVVCVDMWASSSSWPKGTTELWELQAVYRHNEVVAAALDAAAGADAQRVHKTESLGDGRMYVFEPALTPLAVAFVERLATDFPLSDAEPVIRTSVGVAVGSATVSKIEGFRGRPIDIAARLATVAAPDQVLADASAASVFAAHAGLDIDADAKPVRLPGGGSSWDWPRTRVHDVRRAGAEPGHVCNPQARLEQALRLRKQVEQVSTGLSELKGRPDYEVVALKLETGQKHDLDDVRRLAETLAPVYGLSDSMRSVVQDLLTEVVGSGHGARHVEPGYEEMLRLSGVSTTIALLDTALSAFHTALSRHVVAGHPSLNSTLASRDPATVEIACYELRQHEENVRHALREIGKAVRFFIETVPLLVPPSPAMSAAPGAARGNDDPLVMSL